ncbi:MAG: restriction endonuclease subunit S [Candidatus Binatia bacterium]
MQSWRECKLGDVINLKRGYDLPRQDRTPGPYPIVSSSGITDYHEKAKVKGPGVVTGRYGTLGEVFYVEDDFWPLNTSLYIEDFKGNDPRFISYFLRQLNFGSRNAAGAVPGVNRNHLHAMKVRLPSPGLQRRIAGLLSAYDDLIENNQRRIKILEEMARSLYREWFVNFRFPGQEKFPLIDSPLGSVPKGWEVEKLGDLTAYLNRGLSPSYDENGGSIVINQKCIRDQRLSLEPARRQTKQIPPDKRVRFGDVLINSTGVGTLGRVAQVYEELGDCTVDSHVTIARPNDQICLDFFGCTLLVQQETFDRLGAGATGQTELSRTSIANVDLVVPPIEIQDRFGVIVRPMRTAAMTYTKQIQNLRRTRDLLLPRLLSGQLEPPRGAA